MSKEIQNSFKDRIHLEGENPHIVFTENVNVTPEQVKQAKVIDGVHIVV